MYSLAATPRRRGGASRRNPCARFAPSPSRPECTPPAPPRTGAHRLLDDDEGELKVVPLTEDPRVEHRHERRRQDVGARRAQDLQTQTHAGGVGGCHYDGEERGRAFTTRSTASKIEAHVRSRRPVDAMRRGGVDARVTLTTLPRAKFSTPPARKKGEDCRDIRATFVAACRGRKGVGCWRIRLRVSVLFFRDLHILLFLERFPGLIMFPRSAQKHNRTVLS